MGVEQHLMRLQVVGTQHEGAAVAELEMCDLQLGLGATDMHPVFTPVELERLSGGEDQRHVGAAAGLAGLLALLLAPLAGKGGYPVVGAIETFAA